MTLAHYRQCQELTPSCGAGIHGSTSIDSFFGKAKALLGDNKQVLFRWQNGFNESVREVNYNSVRYPDEPLPAREDVERAADSFFLEVNNVTYVLTYEGFQQSLDSMYLRRDSCSNADFAIIYGILSLSLDFTGADSLYNLARRYLYLAIEEGTVQTIQALMISVSTYTSSSGIAVASLFSTPISLQPCTDVTY